MIVAPKDLTTHDKDMLQEIVIWKLEYWDDILSLLLVSIDGLRISPLEANPQNSRRSRRRLINIYQEAGLIIFHTIVIIKINSQEEIKDLSHNIKPKFLQKSPPNNGGIKSIELDKAMYLRKDFQYHQNIAAEYAKLLTDFDLANSDVAANRIQEILEEAEHDDTLSLLLNEVDNLIIQSSSLTCDDEAYNLEYQKAAEVVKTHADSCDQIDPEFSRLMTRISSLIEKIEALKANEVFEDIAESAHSIDSKVESLTLLREEAEVEQDRRWLKVCLNDNESESQSTTLS